MQPVGGQPGSIRFFSMGLFERLGRLWPREERRVHDVHFLRVDAYPLRPWDDAGVSTPMLWQQRLQTRPRRLAGFLLLALFALFFGREDVPACATGGGTPEGTRT
jgi:hypothetical protein